MKKLTMVEGLNQAMHKAMAEDDKVFMLGLDISKEAVRAAAGRYKGHLWLCASAAHIPMADQSIGLLTSLFALTMPEEFRRVLKNDGVFLQVLASFISF